ncbi:ABC transporter substrate-binding protein [Pontibacter sp. JAM-7]|uniref:ABC transporter substrate-binding protein n=1 Tax=Pontibacter sp. JAM-7 TaxID=3366581 RepID=UPI003AF834C7
MTFKRTRLAAALLAGNLLAATAQANIDVQVSYLGQVIDYGPVLSNLFPEPEDTGIRGAELAVTDSNTTGKFLKHHYSFISAVDTDPAKLIASAKQQYANGIRYFVANMPRDTLLQLQAGLGQDAVIFNAGSYDDVLRNQDCRRNIFHTLPSRAMLTDALAQWLKARRISKTLLITGSRPEDQAYADAFKRASKRFGIKIVAEKAWTFDTDMRRTAQSEMPLFTQAKQYDIVITADERGDFGEYVLYNTWYPRPVAGTQGLKPVAWHPVIEQWGAAQLQSRFVKLSNRRMNAVDYASWSAVRSVAEAVTRINSADATAVFDYMTGENFELAAFKGRKMDYRSWNHQLRQPIPLIHPRSVVSQSPQVGFLHPTNELDTLGYDKPESRCKF